MSKFFSFGFGNYPAGSFNWSGQPVSAEPPVPYFANSSAKWVSAASTAASSTQSIVVPIGVADDFHYLYTTDGVTLVEASQTVVTDTTVGWTGLCYSAYWGCWFACMSGSGAASYILKSVDGINFTLLRDIAQLSGASNIIDNNGVLFMCCTPGTPSAGHPPFTSVFSVDGGTTWMGAGMLNATSSGLVANLGGRIAVSVPGTATLQFGQFSGLNTLIYS